MEQMAKNVSHLFVIAAFSKPYHIVPVRGVNRTGLPGI